MLSIFISQRVINNNIHGISHNNTVSLDSKSTHTQWKQNIAMINSVYFKRTSVEVNKSEEKVHFIK